VTYKYHDIHPDTLILVQTLQIYQMSEIELYYRICVKLTTIEMYSNVNLHCIYIYDS